jgi:hypothetical protein
MGYELHITRAENWFESERDPISFDEWVTFAASSQELGTGSAMENPYYGLLSESGQATWLQWSNHQISVGGSGADRSLISAIVKIAAQLSAKVQGDDLEWYG